MKVKDNWYPYREFDVESALLSEMRNDGGAEGTIERIETELLNTQQVLAKFMAVHIKTLQQLNEVVGYDKYEEL